ncbi:flagellar basal-body rod protein FlgG [Sansalvadorimonas sp. 2012CJ34-2]|uniref:Flagellar basal-body rod protein FlgG n=1 Tax=Parendozoicomonas callyspongiae TaxID=2942213 RepID=A0ABT0PGF5_9GAMM|nr:flagellar basal-body rod protein FlgG [Sansalvadorimonas sp. 2012CJ34-2]MCL6270101.1 flagellar basal-body rod protein FlgG [Sansalvadorimonas sp. 2012CJ34-2]
MHASLWVSQTGISAQNTQLSAISNNLANINTVGFKADNVVFEDLFYQIQKQPGSNNTQDNETPTGLQLGTGVRVVGTSKDFSTGAFKTTTGQYDLAVIGQGFFQVAMPDGSNAYTRNGQFQLNSNGEIVTSDGFRLEPSIEVPAEATKVTIGQDGTVSATIAGQAAPQELGQITLVNFVNPAGLSAMGQNLFAETASSGAAQEATPGQDGLGTVRQFALEASNVNMVEEMVNMVTAQRAYEMNTKVLSSVDQMLKYTNQVL